MDAKMLKTLITARDALDKVIKENEVPAAGAGKEEKPVVKKTPTKKVAKLAPVEEDKPAAVKVAAKNTDGKRDITFGVKDAQTKAIKAGLGLPDGKLSDEQTKQFGKDKLNVKKYINELSDEDFDAKTIVDHIGDWLKIKNETKAEEPLTFDILTIEELKGMKDLVETKQVGIYWHPETGRHVTGPAVDSEEGLDEVGDYLVGENTKRVFDKDEKFLGFAVGKFKDIQA
jgi:hypothetical protein